MVSLREIHVAELPATGESGYLYIVHTNVGERYEWVGGTWVNRTNRAPETAQYPVRFRDKAGARATKVLVSS